MDKAIKRKTMVFIDESGIHKQVGQSTTVLVYVKAEDVDHLNKVVLETEKTLKIKPFHWTEQSWKIRQIFLESVIKENFEVKVFILQNPVTEKEIEKAWRHLLIERNINNVIIDGKKSRKYAQHLKKVLRESRISIKKIRTGNDEAFPGLRLADLFAALVRLQIEDPNKEKIQQFYNLAKNKITIRLTDGQVPASLF